MTMTRDKLYMNGKRVYFVDRFGKVQSGKVVFDRADGYFTLNMGGRYGTPQVIAKTETFTTRKAAEAAAKASSED